MELTPVWLLVIFGAALLINRHFIVRLAAVVFLALGLYLAPSPWGQHMHTLLDGAWHLVTGA